MLRITLQYFLLVFVLLKIDQSYGVENVTGWRFGHSGYLPLDSANTDDSDCQVYNENETTCTYVTTPRRSDEQVSVMRAWTALTIRDNIIDLLFGMMHKMKGELPGDAYESVDILYHAALRNGLRTMDILSQLNSISKKKQPAQVVDLFKALSSSVPPCIRSVVNELVTTLSKQKVVLEAVVKMMEDNGIDLIDDIGADLLSRLQYRKKDIKLDKKLEAAHGKDLARLFTYVQKQRVNFTQPVFAALLLNMRFASAAENIEDMRFLVDNLRYSTIKNWDSVAVCCDEITDPYDLVTKTLTSLSESTEVDRKIRDSIETIRHKLFRPGNVPTNSSCPKMSSFMSGPKLDDATFVETFMEVGGNGLRELIMNNSLNVSYALKGFIPSLYDTPDKLVIAFLHRIKYRVPMDPETEKLLSNIISQLRAEFAVGSDSAPSSSDDENGSSTGVSDAATIKTARKKRSINVPRELKSGRVIRCLNYLIDSTKKYLIDNGMIADSICESLPQPVPLSSWKQDLNSPAVYLVLSPEIVRGASEILARTFADNDVLMELWVATTDIDADQTQKDDATRTLKSDTRIIKTKKDQLLLLLRQLLTLTAIQERPLAYHEILRVYCSLIGSCESDTFKKLSMDTRLDERPHDSTIENLADDFVSLPVRRLLEEQQFRKNMSGIKPEDYSTKRMLLVALFKRMLTLDIIRTDERIYNEIVRHLRSIHNLPIRFTDLIATLTIERNKDIEYARTIEVFLSQPNVLYALGEDFNIGLFRTNGLIMKGLLSKLANDSSFQWNIPNLSAAARKMIPKVSCTNYGDEAFQPVADIDEQYFFTTYSSIRKRLEKIPRVAMSFREGLALCADSDLRL